MHDEPDTGRRHAETPWADEQTRQHLQVLVEGVATLAGFAQSSLTLRRDGQFEVVAAAGVEDGFVGTQVPAASIGDETATPTSGACGASCRTTGRAWRRSPTATSRT